jgi:hypothetical protein
VQTEHDNQILHDEFGDKNGKNKSERVSIANAERIKIQNLDNRFPLDEVFLFIYYY